MCKAYLSQDLCQNEINHLHIYYNLSICVKKNQTRRRLTIGRVITVNSLMLTGSIPGIEDNAPCSRLCRIVYIGPRFKFATSELASSDVRVSICASDCAWSLSSL